MSVFDAGGDRTGGALEDGPEAGAAQSGRSFDLSITPGLDSRPGLIDLQFAVQAWSAACSALSVPERSGVLDHIFDLYADPVRRYHDRSHLSAVVVEVVNLAGDLSLDRVERSVAVFAAFFHDAVYEPGAADNEIRSGELAREMLTEAGLARHLVDRVVQAVHATASHRTDDLEAQVLVDADLSILAADEFAYDLSCASLRAEYLTLTDRQWTEFRCRSIERLLARPTIFLTQAKIPAEGPARANLTRELARLKRS